MDKHIAMAARKAMPSVNMYEGLGRCVTITIVTTTPRHPIAIQAQIRSPSQNFHQKSRSRINLNMPIASKAHEIKLKRNALQLCFTEI